MVAAPETVQTCSLKILPLVLKLCVASTRSRRCCVIFASSQAGLRASRAAAVEMGKRAAVLPRYRRDATHPAVTH